MKCFYDVAGLTRDGKDYVLLVDGNAVNTPRGERICHESEGLMLEVLSEWQSQKKGELMDVGKMGLTCLLHGLLDGICKDKLLAIGEMENMLHTDLTLYRAERDGTREMSREMSRLRELQDAGWTSSVRLFEEGVGVSLEVRDGIVYEHQNERSVRKVCEWLEGLGLDDILLLSTGSARCGSLVLSFCLWHGASAEDVWEQCVIEEKFVSERVGEDAEEHQRQKLLLQSLEEVVLYRDALRS